jgi:hypothetical protein
MNPQTNEQSTGMPSWYDPFQEIRTMPKGWNLSSLLADRPAAPNNSFPQEPLSPEDKANPPSKPTALP